MLQIDYAASLASHSYPWHQGQQGTRQGAGLIRSQDGAVVKIDMVVEQWIGILPR